MTATRQRKKKQLEDAQRAMRAIIYLRVSTDEQSKHGRGLDAQRDLCITYAAQQGYEVVKIVTDDGLSGKLPMSKRPGLKEAITMGIAGEIDVVVTYAQDRYARNTGVWAEVRDVAIAAKFRLETVKENRNLADKQERFMGNITAAVSEQEAENIAARLYGGRRERSKIDGRGSGFLPHGFRKIVETVNNQIVERIEIDLEAQKAIRTMLAARDAGKTYEQIADIMTQRKYEKPRGGHVWSFGNVQQLLQHEELYRTGIRTWDDVKSLERWPIIYPTSSTTAIVTARPSSRAVTIAVS